MYIIDWCRRISPHNRLRPPPPSFFITSSNLCIIYVSFHTKINSNAHIYIQTPQRLPLVGKDLRNTIRHGRPSECLHIRRQTACSQGRWVAMVRWKREDGKKGTRPRNHRISSLHNFFTFLYYTILLGIERYHPKVCVTGGTFENRISPEAEVHPNYLLSKVADQHYSKLFV